MPLVNRQYLHKELHTFKNSAVRDLAWCCFSAPMMSQLPGCQVAVFPLHSSVDREWLRELDQAPHDLLNHLQTLKSSRLGIYYEALWHFYFQHHPEWELLHHNLQVDRMGITLGAFDFLCRRGDTYWHIETAVKFYLCAATNPVPRHQWHHWIGPAGEDRLDLKLARLRDHQLPLHQSAEGKTVLARLYPHVSHWNAGLNLQGYLFSPVDELASPEFSHPHHGQGCWVPIAKLTHYLQRSPTAVWTILNRSQWLAPAQTHRNQLLARDELIDGVRANLMATARPVLIARMTLSERAQENDWVDIWTEDSRVFVVPDTWPR